MSPRGPFGGERDLLVANGTARERLRLPPRQEHDPGDILSVAAGRFGWRHLEGLRTADLAGSEETIAEAVVDREPHPSAIRLWRETRIMPLFAPRRRIEKVLRSLVFEDVVFATSGHRFLLLRGDAIDPRSTAVPTRALLDRIRRGDVVAVPRMAWCGDHFRPQNPAHFVPDHLSRALIFRDWLGRPPGTIFLPPSAGPLPRYARTVIAPDCGTIEPTRVHRVGTFELLSSSVVPTGGGHPFWFLDDVLFGAIGGRLRADLPAPPGTGRRVYLGRRDAPKRPLVNEAALASRLAAAGFSIVSMGSLSGPEQLATVAGAEVVVAPHGAALVSLVAARPGTRVVEVFNPEAGTLAFNAIASARDLDYRDVLGAPVARPPGRDAWRVDVDEVMAAALGP